MMVMDTTTLKVYIQKVYHLETTQYEQQLLCNQIRYNINRLKRTTDKPFKKKESYNAEDLFWSGTFALIVMAAIEFVLFLFTDLFDTDTGKPVAVCIAVLAAVLTIAFKIYLVAKRNKQTEKANQAIHLQNTADQVVRDQHCHALKQKLALAEHSLSQTKQTLIAFYNTGVVYPKYRNLIAISSFHEYLASGRCSILEGHEGAYNIFENELRLNLILVKMDDIINRLEEIRDSQYMLYSAIKQSNETTRKLSQSLQNIDNNTAIMAYNSRVTAQNTEFLKWAEFLR